MENGDGHILVFCLNEERFALALDQVVRVLPSLAISPVPEAPEGISGVINVEGDVIAVIDLRSLFELPPGEQRIDDRIIVAQAGEWRIAVVVTEVVEVRRIKAEERVASERILPALRDCLGGVLKLDDGQILIYDLLRFVSQARPELLVTKGEMLAG